MRDGSGSSRMPDDEGYKIDAAKADGSRRIDSTVLFRGTNEVIIEHDGDAYRLRCTARGKLILTK